jgi:hypothetical protein
MNTNDLATANLIATHAYHVLLAQKAGTTGDDYCWGSSGLGAGELQALIDHQKSLMAKEWLKYLLGVRKERLGA